MAKKTKYRKKGKPSRKNNTKFHKLCEIRETEAAQEKQNAFDSIKQTLNHEITATSEFDNSQTSPEIQNEPEMDKDDKNYKYSVCNIEDVGALKRGEGINESDTLINLFARHQIWLVESEALQDTRKIAKTRSWYILNPNLGMGKILAAPISRTSKSGVEIDIGKNFPMYINLEIAHPVNVGKFISYLGVAPDRVRYEVESALSFIYFGKSEDLTSTLTENYNAQRASHMEKDHDTYVYATEIKSNNSVDAATFIRQIRDTPIGHQFDIRSLHLAYLYANASNRASQSTIPYSTRTYRNHSIAFSPIDMETGKELRTNSEPVVSPDNNNENDKVTADVTKSPAVSPEELLKDIPKWDNKDEATPETVEEEKTEETNTPVVRTRKRVMLSSLNQEELLFVKNYSKIPLIRKILGFASDAAVYNLRSRIKADPSIVSSKQSVDIHRSKLIYTKLNIGPRETFCPLNQLTEEEVYELRTFVCVLANNKYQGMRTVFGVSKDFAILKFAELFDAWYDEQNA